MNSLFELARLSEIFACLKFYDLKTSRNESIDDKVKLTDMIEIVY